MTDREIIEAIATKVMGVRLLHHYRDWDPFDSTTMGREVTGKLFWRNAKGEVEEWNPLTNAEASKQLRAKLGSTGFHLVLASAFVNGEYRDSYCELWRYGPAPDFKVLKIQGQADTEERAVALCALKAIGETHE